MGRATAGRSASIEESLWRLAKRVLMGCVAVFAITFYSIDPVFMCDYAPPSKGFPIVVLFESIIGLLHQCVALSIEIFVGTPSQF